MIIFEAKDIVFVVAQIDINCHTRDQFLNLNDLYIISVVVRDRGCFRYKDAIIQIGGSP